MTAIAFFPCHLRPGDPPIDAPLYKQLTFAGSLCYTKRTWNRVMKIFAQRKVRLQDLISAKLPLSEWRAGFELCTEKKG